MLNLQLPLVLSSSCHLPVGVFAFWIRHPGIHLHLNLVPLHLLQLQNKVFVRGKIKSAQVKAAVLNRICTCVKCSINTFYPELNYPT